MISPAEKIKGRRLFLGLNDTDVAKFCGLNIYEYGDVEQHANEALEVTELVQLRKLCEKLKLDILDLCDRYINQEKMDVFENLKRNEIINAAMQKNEITIEKLADAIGFNEDMVTQLMTEPDAIESWPCAYIFDLSQVLRIPFLALICARSA